MNDIINTKMACKNKIKGTNGFLTFSKGGILYLFIYILLVKGYSWKI